MSNPVMQVCPESLNVPQRFIPVTIITGFLGSGKTTLLNHILNNRHGLKIAVIVNEFGDIDIDSQLLVSVDENMVQLGNGCICCTINRCNLKSDRSQSPGRNQLVFIGRNLNTELIKARLVECIAI